MSVILTCYYKPKPGGLCKRLIRSMNALLERGHVVHYLAVEKFPVDHENCFFHRFPWPGSKTENLFFWFFFHTLAPVVLLYLGFRYKISHCYAFVATYGFMLQPLKIIKNIPLTIFMRADIVKNYRLKGTNSAIIFLDTFLEGIAIFNANIYTVSRTLLESVSGRHTFFTPKKSDVLPNNISSSVKSLQKDNVNKLPIKVVAVGRLDKGKNLATLLNTFSYLPKKIAHLYIFGEGPLGNALKLLVDDFDINDQVTFMGWQDDSELIWGMADILAFPSLYEGSPNAILEALAHHVPVIASDIPEHKELLPDSCLLGPLDVTAWKNKLLEISNDPAKILPGIYRDCSEKIKNYSFDWESKVVSAITCTKA